MEDENGNPVPQNQRNAVCERARKFFNLFLTSEKLIPPTSKRVDIRVMDEFISLMEENHFFLCLCDNHWKSEQVFRTYYPPWHKTNVKKPKELAEVIDVDDVDTDDIDIDNIDADTDGEDHGGPSKWPRLDDSNYPHKMGAKSPPPPSPHSRADYYEANQGMYTRFHLLYALPTRYSRTHCMEPPTTCVSVLRY